MKEIYNKVISFWWSSGLAYDAPALAFYILISLAPLAVGLSVLAEIFFPSTLSPENITDSLATIFPDRLNDSISKLAKSNKGQTPVILALSAFLMVWTVSAALSVIERAESRILRSENKKILIGRIRIFFLGALFTLILLFLLASLASDVVPLSLSVLLLPASFLSLALLYRFLPKKRASWKNSFLGAVPASLGLYLLPKALSLYLSFGFRPSFAGLFAVLAIFIVSCYLLSVFFLLGAGLAARGEPLKK